LCDLSISILIVIIKFDDDMGLGLVYGVPRRKGGSGYPLQVLARIMPIFIYQQTGSLWAFHCYPLGLPDGILQNKTVDYLEEIAESEVNHNAS
jgi:hypothetical protein